MRRRRTQRVRPARLVRATAGVEQVRHRFPPERGRADVFRTWRGGWRGEMACSDRVRGDRTEQKRRPAVQGDRQIRVVLGGPPYRAEAQALESSRRTAVER